MPKSDTLSRTAQTVLAAAAGRDGHSAFPPEHLPAAAKRAVVQSLLKAGLLEEIAAADDGVAWRTTKDGKRLTLRATAAGLAAVGSTIIWDGPTGSIAPENGQTSAPAAEVQPALDPLPTESADPVNVGVTIRPDLRSAAQAVLAAWDDVDGNRPALPGAVEALRAVLATRSATRTGTLSGMPRQPRPDTKRAAVLALLRRPEGASVAQVIEMTGWAPHTIRGFFAGLKKAGIPVEVLERVRQVGPGREGAKGSYTVYRAVEVG